MLPSPVPDLLALLTCGRLAGGKNSYPSLEPDIQAEPEQGTGTISHAFGEH